MDTSNLCKLGIRAIREHGSCSGELLRTQYCYSEASKGTVAGEYDDGGGEDDGGDGDDDGSHLPPFHQGTSRIQYYPHPSIYRTWWKQENPTPGLIPINLRPFDFLTSP